MSFPIEAKVVHLQLLVALTAQRLWALNLHTERQHKEWSRVFDLSLYGKSQLQVLQHQQFVETKANNSGE